MPIEVTWEANGNGSVVNYFLSYLISFDHQFINNEKASTKMKVYHPIGWLKKVVKDWENGENVDTRKKYRVAYCLGKLSCLKQYCLGFAYCSFKQTIFFKF